MALHNYHNAHENKRLASRRTIRLTWCQLVSEADHFPTFSQEGRNIDRGREREFERLRRKKE